MSVILSQRVEKIKPSPTLAVSAKAQALKASGKDVVGLGTGEPDFDTPENIKEAAIKAINAGRTKYTPVDGIPALKEAIVKKFKRDNQLDYELSQILVSVGGKQSIFNLCQALIDKGDEVLIPAPYWVSYPDIAILAGGVPKYIETTIDNEYKITASQLASAITKKTKLFFINSPSNPSGKHYSECELTEIAGVLRDNPHVFIATDDMYEHMIFAGKRFMNIVNVAPDLYERTIVLNGVSKAYAMTGWRIGYAGGPESLIKAMKKVQSQSTSNPCSIAQWAALEALNGPQDAVLHMRDVFEKRHQHVYKELSEMSGVRVIPSDGTFYIFPDISVAMQKKGLKSDVDFCRSLLEDELLAVVPGSAFGTPGCIRLSFAASDEMLSKALARLKHFIA